MNTFFECIVKYEKTTEVGATKKVSEPYLVDALSFTEAEKRFVEEITPYMSGEFEVKAVKRANYTEVISSSDEVCDRWFKAKVAFITLDEKTGVEKKNTVSMLVQASDVRNALDNLDRYMKGSLADYTVTAVSETPICDVYYYEPQNV